MEGERAQEGTSGMDFEGVSWEEGEEEKLCYIQMWILEWQLQAREMWSRGVDCGEVHARGLGSGSDGLYAGAWKVGHECRSAGM